MAIKDRYFLEDVRRVSFSKKYKIMSLWVLTGAQQSPVTQIQFCSQKVGCGQVMFSGNKLEIFVHLLRCIKINARKFWLIFIVYHTHSAMSKNLESYIFFNTSRFYGQICQVLWKLKWSELDCMIIAWNWIFLLSKSSHVRVFGGGYYTC